MMKYYIDALLSYGIENELIREEDRLYCFNRLLAVLRLDCVDEDGSSVSCPELEAASGDMRLPLILGALCDNAAERGVIADNSVARDLFDTELMNVLTPFPHEVKQHFYELLETSPEAATDWYYRFCGDTNYIRRERIKKDLKWLYSGKYGELEITVNLSKPEKDPKAIAAALHAPQSSYPKCQLCAENQGYAGRMNFPARGNHRPIPIRLAGEDWFLQYSPYVYFNEHCIAFNSKHVPMKVDESAFRRLIDFVTLFPHYFIGSNADLPIVGGSILTHDHFQGGRHCFPMFKAPVYKAVSFEGFEDVRAGLVDWPMSVIRLQSAKPESIIRLSGKILGCWREYTDEAAFIFAHTDGVPHNTVTPIARREGKDYVMELVLRNNITTEEHPLGVFHPHSELHHIKKENIGLIEVMGLAVLPSRLKNELELLEKALAEDEDISGSEALGKHASWLEDIKKRRNPAEEELEELLRQETGAVFQRVLEDAGVYKRSPEGEAAFLRFTDSVK